MRAAAKFLIPVMLAGVTTAGGAAAGGATYKTIYSFQGGSDGSAPFGALLNVKGTLYGTTTGGGSHKEGIVFALDPASGTETVVHAFTGTAHLDGAEPVAGLTEMKGTLYGTTLRGGIYGLGTIFTIDPANNSETVAYSFTNTLPTTSAGHPAGALTALNGLLYGTSYRGGDSPCGYYCGTVYSFDPGSHSFALIYSFYQNDSANGSNPWAGVLNVNGTLYGITLHNITKLGAVQKNGAVYALDPATGTETTLHIFNGRRVRGDGFSPYGGLVAAGGLLYGTTLGGGASAGGYGTIFSVDPQTGAETVVYSFTGGNDGVSPQGSLLNVNGLLYGTTVTSVFSFDPASGTLTVLHDFTPQSADGDDAVSGLIDAGGTLYGTTRAGGGSGCGGSGCGTVFSITP